MPLMRQAKSLTGTLLNECICTEDTNCNFDSVAPSYCTIDTTSPDWKATTLTSIKKGGTGAFVQKLKISYDNSKNFLIQLFILIYL